MTISRDFIAIFPAISSKISKTNKIINTHVNFY